MRSTLTMILAMALGGLGFLHPFGTTTVTPARALPYYDTREFTPKWTSVDHRVAPFHLIDQENRPLTEKDLDGKIHVASFLFAQCPSLCPTLVQRLKPVQEAIRGHPDVMMVSYTVTPLTDTPAVLADFGHLRGIDPKRWRLATGEPSEIRRLVRDSYFADDDRPIDGAPQSRLLHSEKVLLVDSGRHLRGIYNGTNAFEMERLVEDIATLGKEK